MRKHLIAASLLSMGLLGLGTAGCGEDQPNAPATTTDVAKPDFGKSAADMMKNANSGMDPKKDKPDVSTKK